MSIGQFGVKRAADVDPSDIEVIVLYSKTRNSTETQTVTKLNGVDAIKPVMSTTALGGTDLEILGGLYNLTLPKTIFAIKGFYTVYIRPTQIRIPINDCAELATFPDIKGLVFDVSTAPVNFINKFVNNGLDGYRIEYLNNDGTKIPNLYRIVTSSFLSEPTNVQTANSSQKAVKYIYYSNGSKLFCTVTPNAAPSFKPTSTPYIGKIGQNVIITNTNFSPQIIEVEMVNYDIESLAVALYGNQSKNIDSGIYSLYDDDGNIFAQYDLYEIRDSVDKKLFEMRIKRTNIDHTSDLKNIVK